MNPSVAVAVQHAPWAGERKQLLDAVLTRLQEQPDEEWPMRVTPPQVVYDRGSRERPEGVWPTNRRAWSDALEMAHDLNLTHCYVGQDDQLPVSRFWLGAYRAIEARPHDVLVFLCARRQMTKAAEHGYSWVTLPDGTWGGTTLMPRDLLEQFLAWEAENVLPSCPSADARVDLWLRATDRAAYATVPSLIQHVGERSLIGHAKGRRTPVLADDGAQFSAQPMSPVKSPRALNRHMFSHLRERESA